MRRNHNSLIGLFGIIICFLSINSFADQYQGYIALADKLVTCTPTSMQLPDPIFNGTDTWVIKGVVQGNCMVSNTISSVAANVFATSDCAFPMSEMQNVAAAIREFSGPPTNNPQPSAGSNDMDKYCKTRNTPK